MATKNTETRTLDVVEATTSRVLAEEPLIDLISVDDAFSAWIWGRDLQDLSRYQPVRKIPRLEAPGVEGSAVKFRPGGDRIKAEIINDLGDNAGFIRMGQAVNTDQIDPTTAILFDWKTFYSSVAYNKLRANRCQGESQLRDYVATIIQATRSNATRRMAAAYLSVNGITSEYITGLQVLVPTTPNTGTVFGIDRSTETYFRSIVKNGASTPFSLQTLSSGIDDATVGPNRPQYCWTTKAIYQAIRADLLSRQRYAMLEKSSMAKLGFSSIMVEDDIGISWSPSVPTGYLWGLNRGQPRSDEGHTGIRFYVNEYTMLDDFNEWITSPEYPQLRQSTTFMECEMYTPDPRLNFLYYGIST